VEKNVPSEHIYESYSFCTTIQATNVRPDLFKDLVEDLITSENEDRRLSSQRFAKSETKVGTNLRRCISVILSEIRALSF